ncbi:hypothetical protein [Mesorhizobium sp.]|uniref:hypothetical protein n=1 Tax=Mesorhizobium sp. TaxID=1871066 RepID=UPI0025F03BCF|nr:hypothetical protein [Mesorhizobium sp.]
MTTTANARSALKARVGAIDGLSIYWQGDVAPILPDTPAPFAFIMFNNDGSGRQPVAFGGGRGRNTYRNRASVEAYVFEPVRTGTPENLLANAEAIAARLRSYRDDVVSCTSADVIPIGPGSSLAVPGLSGPVNNYQCAAVEVALTFDQIG